MTAICQSCGGVVGRDCFNPTECAEITRQMHEHYAEDRILRLERAVIAIGNFLHTHVTSGTDLSEEFEKVVNLLRDDGIHITQPRAEPQDFDEPSW